MGQAFFPLQPLGKLASFSLSGQVRFTQGLTLLLPDSLTLHTSSLTAFSPDPCSPVRPNYTMYFSGFLGSIDLQALRGIASPGFTQAFRKTPVLQTLRLSCSHFVSEFDHGPCSFSRSTYALHSCLPGRGDAKALLPEPFPPGRYLGMHQDAVPCCAMVSICRQTPPFSPFFTAALHPLVTTQVTLDSTCCPTTLSLTKEGF